MPREAFHASFETRDTSGAFAVVRISTTELGARAGDEEKVMFRAGEESVLLTVPEAIAAGTALLQAAATIEGWRRG